MENIDLDKDKISELLSKKLGEDVKIESIEKAGQVGYRCDGFRLKTDSGKSYFLRKVKGYKMGFTFPERKIASLSLNKRMAERLNTNPKQVCIAVSNNGKMENLPDFNEHSEFYHIQDYEEEGKSYQDILMERKDKKEIDEQDIKELEKITDYIVSLHKIKYPSEDAEELKEVYNNSLMSIIFDPELTTTSLHTFGENHPILPPAKHKEYIGLLLDLIYKWKNKSDRLVALHGDFWGGNVFFRKDGSIWVVDHSIIPWGDPGFDIGWFVHSYLWVYYETDNKYFLDLAKRFLSMYEEKSGDKEIRKASSLSVGPQGIVFAFLVGHAGFSEKNAKRFYENALKTMKEGELTWLD